MKITMYALFISLVGISGIFYTIPEKPSNATDHAAAFKNWQSSPDGIKFKNWEASPTGKKVHAGAIKINRAIRGNASLTGVVTSMTMPAGSRLGFGIMVDIQGEEYILAFGEANNQELDALRNLQVHDKISIKSHHVSKAPKYAFAIVTPARVMQGSKIVYKRIGGKGGC